MTRGKQGQRVLWEGVVDEDVRALWEPWMVEADKLLQDEELIDVVYEAQGERHQQSATRWPLANTRRDGITAAAVEACTELELRHVGTRSEDEPDVS